MKKLIACLLTVAMLVGIVPAVLAANTSAKAADTKSIKVLVIGDKFARSGFELLYKVFDAEGYTDICTSYLFQDGITLSEYAAGISGATPATYKFGRNVRDFADDQASGTSLKAAVTWEKWDYIVLQSGLSGAEDAAAMTKAVETLVPYIKTLNSKAKIGLHVDWAKEGNTASFEKIAAAAQKTILDSGKIDFAVPVGTAIMNVQSSFMGTGMYKPFKTWKTVAKGVREGDQPDNTNLNHLGELIAAYGWYAAICNTKLTEMKLADTAAHVEINLSSAERKVILEAINNAMSKPYAITKSAYPTEPAQYTAVVVNDHTDEYMAGDTVTITAKAVADGQRKFQKWIVTEGNATITNATATTTTFKMPAQNVRIEPVYENTKNVIFQVGFGRSDVTPDQPINLAGSGDAAERMSTGTHPDYPEDRLTMSAIALADGTTTHIVMTTDFIRVPTAWSKKAEDAVYAKYGQQYGLNEFCLTMTATHSHMGPDIGDKDFGILQKAKNVNSHEDGKNYWYFRDFWLPGVVEAAGEALADLTPVAETKVTSVRVPGLAWVRHWRDGRGQLTGVNFTGQSTANGYKGYFRVSDEEMQMVNFVRDNAQDIVLVNHQGHPGGMSSNWDKREMVTIKGVEKPISYTYLSSEYPGFACRYIQDNYKDEEGQAVYAAYFQGACGNSNAQCLMSSVKEKYGYDNEANNKWGIDKSTFDPDDHGWQLGDYAVTALKEMKTVQTGEVKVLRQQFLGTEYQYDVTREMEQDVVTIGSSIAFATAGYEMFERNGRYVKDNSPYEITMIMENSQGHEYMPDWQTWHITLAGGGEPYATKNTQTNVAMGTAEDLAYAMVGLLNVTYEE